MLKQFMVRHVLATFMSQPAAYQSGWILSTAEAVAQGANFSRASIATQLPLVAVHVHQLDELLIATVLNDLVSLSLVRTRSMLLS